MVVKPIKNFDHKSKNCHHIIIVDFVPKSSGTDSRSCFLLLVTAPADTHLVLAQVDQRTHLPCPLPDTLHPLWVEKQLNQACAACEQNLVSDSEGMIPQIQIQIQIQMCVSNIWCQPVRGWSRSVSTATNTLASRKYFLDICTWKYLVTRPFVSSASAPVFEQGSYWNFFFIICDPS